MNTHALRAVLEWHTKAEEFDRTLPGEWVCGEWVPAIGAPMRASIAHAQKLERIGKAYARDRGVTREEWKAASAWVCGLTYREKRDLLGDMVKADDRTREARR